MALGSGEPRLVKFTPSGELANSPGLCQDAYRTPVVEMARDGSLPSLLPGSITEAWNPGGLWVAAAGLAATRETTRSVAADSEAILELIPAPPGSSARAAGADPN